MSGPLTEAVPLLVPRLSGVHSPMRQVEGPLAWSSAERWSAERVSVCTILLICNGLAVTQWHANAGKASAQATRGSDQTCVSRLAPLSPMVHNSTRTSTWP